MIDVRPATPDDARALAALRWEFRAPRATPTESAEAFTARCGEWMRIELACGRWCAWVALDDGRIVGQLWMFLMPRIPNPSAELERHAYISNVYVTPESRGGAGSPLLKAALEQGESERRRFHRAVANRAQPDSLHAPRLRGRRRGPLAQVPMRPRIHETIVRWTSAYTAVCAFRSRFDSLKE